MTKIPNTRKELKLTKIFSFCRISPPPDRDLCLARTSRPPSHHRHHNVVDASATANACPHAASYYPLSLTHSRSLSLSPTRSPFLDLPSPIPFSNQLMSFDTNFGRHVFHESPSHWQSFSYIIHGLTVQTDYLPKLLYFEIVVTRSDKTPIKFEIYECGTRLPGLVQIQACLRFRWISSKLSNLDRFSSSFCCSLLLIIMWVFCSSSLTKAIPNPRHHQVVAIPPCHIDTTYRNYLPNA